LHTRNMGKIAVYKYFSFVMLVLTIVMMGFTIFGLFGGMLPPDGNTAKAMLVYVLPFLVIGNVFLLLYWLIRRRWHWALIPLLTTLSCIPYIGTFYQFRSIDTSKTDPACQLKVATYNVAMFSREANGFIAQDILAQMKRQKVDILCMQEYSNTSGDRLNSDSYKEVFPYMATGKNDMVIYSKYPIKKNKTILFGQRTNNSAMWADINVEGKIIRVLNAHLETTGFNRTLRKKAEAERRTASKQERNQLLNAIYSNYTMGMMIRAKQVETIGKELQADAKQYALIVCGDFNDVPYSYVYRQMKGDLVDGFKECGSGWMFTYRSSKSARIDYIFHDKTMKGIKYYKQEISYSDHYPVFMELSF
jgi:endonuclease/exonuclease/phosphatase family metal-dependent hydrolase